MKLKNTVFCVVWGCNQNTQSQPFDDIASAQAWKEAISEYVSNAHVYARIRDAYTMFGRDDSSHTYTGKLIKSAKVRK